MRLSDRQRALFEVVRGARSPESLADELGQSVGRVAVYRDFVRDHVTGILNKLYPEARALLDDCASLDAAFYGEHAPTRRDLNLAGEPYPGFLERHGHHFAAAIAQLEWEIFAAAVHPAVVEPDAPAREPDALRSARRYTSQNPTLVLFEQHFPAVQHLARGPRSTPVERLTPPQVVMVYRRPSHHVAFRVLDELAARVLTQLANGAPLDGSDEKEALALGFITVGA